MYLETLGSHSTSPRVCIIGNAPGVSAFTERRPFAGWEYNFIRDKCLRAGFTHDEVLLATPTTQRRNPSYEEWNSFLSHINSIESLRVLVPMGDALLLRTTGKASIDKWNLSPLDGSEGIRCPKILPTYGIDRVNRDFALNLYVERALIRAREGCEYEGPWKRKDYRFRLNPSIEETFLLLDWIYANVELVGLDIETGRGQINTVGLAWSKEDALVMQTLPSRCSAENFHTLWKKIARILEEKRIGKIIQNSAFEVQRFAQYGIRIENIAHDTMWAMKFLWPEFEKGLGNVGRFYTMEPYWKDDGRTVSEEGGKKDWGNVRDWQKHFLYNAKDCTGMFEAAENQVSDLMGRGQLDLFRNYIMKLAPCMQEMVTRGLPPCEETRKKMEVSLEEEIASLTKQFSSEINPRSPKQKKELLKAKGYKIPKVRVNGKFQESTNELSLKKMRLRYPGDSDIEVMLKLVSLNKALSSYVKFVYHKDERMRFSLDCVGTETGRFSSSTDAWGWGMNAQTIPKRYKVIFKAPEGKVWVQADLGQAESRFVAYDSADYGLIEMLEDPSKDIHSYVAAEIFKCSVEQVLAEKEAGNISKRQLGKKSGHGANYSMKETTFMESCLKEMDLVLSKDEAKNVLESYHRLFPGIRRWQASIREEVSLHRKLDNPFGRVRYFYGRMDDNLFREAYAYRPQSTVPDITNQLMLKLCAERTCGNLEFDLHLQVHDSVVMLCDEDKYQKVADYCLATEKWHPEIILKAGKLVIPTDVEVGKTLKDLKSYRGK